MLGHQATLYLSQKKEYKIIDLSFRDKFTDNTIICDITNKDELSQIVKEICPDIIINCVGVLIKGSNSNPANAIYINAYFPHFLRGLAEEINAKVIHISTDCVFSGKKGSYTLDDPKDGSDVYAQSKSLGEIITNNHLTLRTSIIGPELKENGEGLFHWFMNSEGTVNGFTQAIWSGVTTTELVKVIHVSIQNELTGIVHITNNTPIDKFNLLKIIKSNFSFKTPIIKPVDGPIIDKSLVDKNFIKYYTIPTYEKMIEEMKTIMKINHKLYRKYFKE